MDWTPTCHCVETIKYHSRSQVVIISSNMEYSLDDYVKQISSLHQDEDVDSCTEHMANSDAVDAFAKTNMVEKRRSQEKSIDTIALSHRSVGNEGLDTLVDAILNAKDRQMEKKRRIHIDRDDGSSLQQDDGDLANRIQLRCANIKRINSLASLLTRSNSMEVLDLSQNELGNEGIIELCNDISHQCHEQTLLRSLFLRRCEISCEGLIAIASLMIPQYDNRQWAPLPIETMDLSRNDIGNDGVTALAKAISWEGCSLQSLDLSRCSINEERSRGLCRLFSAMLSNARNATVTAASHACMLTNISSSTENSSNLITLKLNGNELGANCFAAIAASMAGDAISNHNNERIIHYCPSLQNLYLNDTNMSPASAKNLAKALATNTGLKILSISGNSIDNDTVKCYANALRSNRTLSLLLLGRSRYLTQDGVEALANCIYDESSNNNNAALLSLAASNHTIEDFGLFDNTSIRLEHALYFNFGGNDEWTIQRKKIASFLNRDCRRIVHHFAAMFGNEPIGNNKVCRSTALPFVVRYCNLSCAFEMIRGMPEFCCRNA